MNDRELIHKLSELKTVKVAPALWRAGARERLLSTVERQVDKPYSWAESFQMRLSQFKLAAAPLPLVPMFATLVLPLVGGVPFTSAMVGSLPGSSLYPVKRTFEQVELAFRPGPTAQGLLQLDFASRRLTELNQLPEGSSEATRLLRDYNIALGFAQASLRAAPASSSVAATYDAYLAELSSSLSVVQVGVSARPAYLAALNLTDRISGEALGLLVAAHQAGQNGLLPQAVSERLARHITKLEVKLSNVDTKIQGFPQNEPTPRVVLESRQVIVPLREARQLAKVSLAQAKALVEKNEFTLALQKVQEGEEITVKAEEAVEKVAEEKVEGAATEAEPTEVEPAPKPTEGVPAQPSPVVEPVAPPKTE